jgi:hypothetical protein
VDQIVEGEDARCDAPIEPCETNPEQALCKYKDQVDVYVMDAPLSVGPVFARHIGHRMYRGEYYATQSDAHVSFTTKWDSDIIQQMEATHNDMAVLTTYLTDVQGSIDPKTGASLRNTRVRNLRSTFLAIADFKCFHVVSSRSYFCLLPLLSLSCATLITKEEARACIFATAANPNDIPKSTELPSWSLGGPQDTALAEVISW